MTFFLLVAAATAGAPTVGNAATPQGGYCQDAQAMSDSESGYHSLPAKLFAHCQPGDTIVLDGVPQTVGIVCDFSRSIVSSGRSVICVMAAQPRQVH
jgi:hypothetical protein